jgi:hypothetical protein
MRFAKHWRRTKSHPPQSPFLRKGEEEQKTHTKSHPPQPGCARVHFAPPFLRKGKEAQKAHTMPPVPGPLSLVPVS